MIPRGEVGLIFATIGLREGILGENLYAALLLVVLVTTLLTPPLAALAAAASSAPAAGRPDSTAPEPDGGWLRVDDGVVDLAAEPPSRARAPRRRSTPRSRSRRWRAAGPRLLDWIGAWSDTPLRWDDDATQAALRRC